MEEIEEIKIALAEIENGWKAESNESGAIIDFKNYTPYIDKIREFAEKKGIKANIQPTFSGLTWEYLR